jgi:isopentenyl phosphate kinase
MIFIKLGGSLISDVSKPFSMNWTSLGTVVDSLSQIDEEMIVFHGGGGFGSFIAREYAGTEVGFFKIREAMSRMNNLVVSSFIAKGIPAVGFSPGSFMVARNGKITEGFFDQIVGGMKTYVPVLHSDAVLDRENGYSYISSEKIMNEIAKHAKPRRVLVACNSSLLMDGEKVKEIADWNYRDIVPTFTPEIRAKVIETAELSADHKLEVYVFDGSSPDAIKRAWKYGEGTRIQVTRIPKLFD